MGDTDIMRQFLFNKTKNPVPFDLWLAGNYYHNILIVSGWACASLDSVCL